VELIHSKLDNGSDNLHLYVHVYGEDHQRVETYSEVRTTADGVPCFFALQSSGTWPSVDGGPVRVGPPAGSSDWLEAEYVSDTSRYFCESRAGSTLPDWLSDEAIDLRLEGDGNGPLGPYAHDFVRRRMPRFLAPVCSGVFSPDPSGDFQITWEGDAQEETRVVLESNMEGAPPIFVCKVPSGVTGLTIARQWLEECCQLNPGRHLRLEQRTVEHFDVSGAQITLEVLRLSGCAVELDLD